MYSSLIQFSGFKKSSSNILDKIGYDKLSITDLIESERKKAGIKSMNKIDDLLARLAIASNNKKIDESKRILSEIDRLRNKTGLSAEVVDNLATKRTKQRFYELVSKSGVKSFEIGFTVRKDKKDRISH